MFVLYEDGQKTVWSRFSPLVELYNKSTATHKLLAECINKEVIIKNKNMYDYDPEIDKIVASIREAF